MKYIVAAGVSIVMLALFVLVAVAARWTHGGGYLVQAALWSTVFVTWRSIVGNWDTIVARMQGRSNTTHAPIFEAHVKATIIAGVLIIGIVAVFGMVRSHGQQKEVDDAQPAAPTKGDPGSMPYLPSRLEWLAVDMNASLRTDFTVDHPYSITFLKNAKERNLVIFVSRMPDLTPTDRQRLDAELKVAKYVVAKRAESLGWSSWLNVEVRYYSPNIGGNDYP